TVTLNCVPAVRAEGVPVLPVTDPAAAVSPGMRICSLLKPALFTVVFGLVSAVFDGSVASLAVTVLVPAVLRVTLKVPVPVTRAALAGSTALASDDVIATVSVTDVTML